MPCELMFVSAFVEPHKEFECPQWVELGPSAKYLKRVNNRPSANVEQDRGMAADGRDPQLDTAVSLALDDRAKAPLPQPSRPPFLLYGTPSQQ